MKHKRKSVRMLTPAEVERALTNLERKHGHDAVRWAYAYDYAEGMHESYDTKDYADLIFNGQEPISKMSLKSIANLLVAGFDFGDAEAGENLAAALGDIATYAKENHGLKVGG